MKAIRSMLLLAAGFALQTGGLADVIIEGSVALPVAKGRAATARYQQTSGQVIEPEKPTAVVYLEGKFATAATPPTAEIVQKGYQFFPALLPVRTGTTVHFPNADEDYHHVFSYSKAKEFDLGRYRKDQKSPPVVFDKPGPVTVGCEIHNHMRATVLVLESPHFVRTDAAGTYRLVLKGVPPGKYTLKAWIDAKTLREKPVEIGDSGSMKVDFATP